MSRIDVAYGAQHRLKQASQTVYKQFLAGKSTLVYCSDQQRLSAFSKELWSVERTAFVPHPFWGEGPVSSVVQLCASLEEDTIQGMKEKAYCPWLINLDLYCPPYYQYFSRVLEIVSTHPEDQKWARERIKQYKTEGNSLFYHQL